MNSFIKAKGNAILDENGKQLAVVLAANISNSQAKLWAQYIVDRENSVVPTMYEDELPEQMSDEDYSRWFANSKVIDGVRIGPRVSSSAGGSHVNKLTTSDLSTGDTIRDPKGELWSVEFVFPEKVVAKRTIDIFDLEGWEKPNMYGKVK